jgi:ATP-dependent DNA helicase RecG
MGKRQKPLLEIASAFDRITMNVDLALTRSILRKGIGTQVAFLPERCARIAIAETLGAMANTQGGIILLGVTKAGAVRGVRDAEAQREKALSAALLANPPLVLPMPVSVAVDGRTLIAVQVPQGLPHVYAVEDRYLIRDGAENHCLKMTQVHELMTRRGLMRFETQIAPSATTKDLDTALVKRYVEQIGQSGDLNEILQKRGCLAQTASGLRPTCAGTLVFAPDPSSWIAGAQITAICYPGREMGDEFVRQDIAGPLDAQIRQAEAFLVANTRQKTVVEGLTHKEYPTYPRQVLREMLVNAVAHRDYSIDGEAIRVLMFDDRVTVYSPGRLPGHVTIENIVTERFSRNPIIVQVLADMGFIERLGYGIDRILRLLEEKGYPPPTFEETAAGFQVTVYAQSPSNQLRRARKRQLDLNERQEQALDYVIEHGRIANREYQTLCPDVSAETIRRDLSDMVHKDILLRIGRKRATYYILKDAALAEG